LLWEHADQPIGYVDPDRMRTDDRGLIVGGHIDRDSDKGELAWKMVKNRSAGFSIGFASQSRPRKGSGRVLFEIDLLEISITSKPMHPSTRALNWKDAERIERAPATRPIEVVSFEVA
jgi:HK97 family phage prohead protease